MISPQSARARSHDEASSRKSSGDPRSQARSNVAMTRTAPRPSSAADRAAGVPAAPFPVMPRHDDPAVRSVLILGLLAAILAAAAFLRLVELGANPGGLYVDEAAEALDAHRLLTVAGFHP